MAVLSLEFCKLLCICTAAYLWPVCNSAANFPPTLYLHPLTTDPLWLVGSRYKVGLDKARGATTFHISYADSDISVVNAHGAQICKCWGFFGVSPGQPCRSMRKPSALAHAAAVHSPLIGGGTYSHSAAV